MASWKLIHRAPSVHFQAGRDDAAVFAWTDDLMRLAIHLDGTVSVRRFARGRVLDRIIVAGCRLSLSRRWPTDLSDHPVWEFWHEVSIMTLQEFEDALILVLT